MDTRTKNHQVQSYIAETMSRIYDSCYYCDAKKDTFVQYIGFQKEGKQEEKKRAYSQMLLEIVEHYVREEDVLEVMSKLSLDYVRNHLDAEHMTYTVYFRQKNMLENVWIRCIVLYIDADLDGGLRRFLVVLDDSTEMSSKESNDDRRERYYSELRRSVMNEELYQKALLATGIVVYHINLSKDLIEDNIAQKYEGKEIPILPVVGIQTPCSYNEYCANWTQRVSSSTLGEYEKADTCAKLLNEFAVGNRTFSVCYRTTDAVGREIYIQKNLFMEKDIDTGDVMALCYLTLANHGIVDGIDQVTKIPDNDAYTQMLEEKVENGDAIRVLKFGIQSFSNVNLMYGHECANLILKNFVHEVLDIANGRFEMYRLPGVKFALVLNDSADEQKMRRIYSEVVEIATEKVYLETVKVPLKLYGGGVIADGFYGKVDTLKSIGTYAIIKSKYDHHGELVVLNELDSGQDVDFEMLTDMYRCIGNGCDGFYICYQPLADSASGKIIGAEALLRWNMQPYGEVPPGRFIPWVENDPIFYDLGNWVLRTALKEGMKVKEKYPYFTLNVNVAASQIERNGFREKVVEALKESGFPPKDLCLELTERCRNLDLAFLREEILYFRSLGIRIAMDDFGTGNASLSLLEELPVDELKVDMSFIRNIMKKPVHKALVRSIVQCANELDMDSCLEGVENQELVDYLAQFHATYYQGYYYSKPVRLEKFMELLP